MIKAISIILIILTVTVSIALVLLALAQIFKCIDALMSKDDELDD